MAMETAQIEDEGSAVDHVRGHQLRLCRKARGRIDGVFAGLMIVNVGVGKHSPAAVESSCDEHCDIIAALKKRARIAHAFHKNRHLHAAPQFIQPSKEPRQI